jgi:hypothetical protein
MEHKSSAQRGKKGKTIGLNFVMSNIANEPKLPPRTFGHGSSLLRDTLDAFPPSPPPPSDSIVLCLIIYGDQFISHLVNVMG